MTHRRNRIRDAVTALLADIPAAGGRVYNSRVFPVRELPCIAVYTLRENSTLATLQRRTTRLVQVVIDIHAQATERVDDDLDNLATEIEKRLEADWQLSGLAINSAIDSTVIGLSGEAQKATGLARLTYEYEYTVTAGAPDAA
ncbi:hypothetical protein [Oceanibaculum nanhaiense]|uniref:hypothetical protein n=1 Tax=Oceanibaculum nanhaiense TaxID=1909734 RepID=UPI003D2829D6